MQWLVNGTATNRLVEIRRKVPEIGKGRERRWWRYWRCLRGRRLVYFNGGMKKKAGWSLYVYAVPSLVTGSIYPMLWCGAYLASQASSLTYSLQQNVYPSLAQRDWTYSDSVRSRVIVGPSRDIIKDVSPLSSNPLPRSHKNLQMHAQVTNICLTPQLLQRSPASRIPNPRKHREIEKVRSAGVHANSWRNSFKSRTVSGQKLLEKKLPRSQTPDHFQYFWGELYGLALEWDRYKTLDEKPKKGVRDWKGEREG